MEGKSLCFRRAPRNAKTIGTAAPRRGPVNPAVLPHAQ